LSKSAPEPRAWPADQVERRPIAGLLPSARNARTHSPEQIAQIAASITRWGWTTPVLIDEAGGIIAGHGRVLAAAQLGLVDVPTVTARGWAETEKRAYLLADNKLALNAGWDPELLRLELGELRGLDFDLGLIGFEDEWEQSLGLGPENIRPLESLPVLPSGERGSFQQMTFILHDEQVESVRAALQMAKNQGPFVGANENGNGNALARICELFVGEHGDR
jgi:ParB-like chromosome segregation protein Spo0J